MEQQPAVSIIIVSHNTKQYTLDAVTAVRDTVKTHSYELIVVENASTDGSYEVLEKLALDASFHLTLEKTSELIGFSAANNVGAKKAQGELLFFLNPDTNVQDGAIDLLIEHYRSLPTVGAMSGQLLYGNGSIQPQGGALPNLLNIVWWMLFIDDIPFIRSFIFPYQQRNQEYYKKLQTHHGWIGGTAFMISKALFEKVGGWDEKIFMYGEDVELSKRIHDAGKTVAIYPGAKIIHYQNKSTGGSRRAKLGEFDGLLYYWKKHKPGYELPCIRILLWIGAWLRVLLFGILGRNETDKQTYIEAASRTFMA